MSGHFCFFYVTGEFELEKEKQIYNGPVRISNAACLVCCLSGSPGYIRDGGFELLGCIDGVSF